MDVHVSKVSNRQPNLCFVAWNIQATKKTGLADGWILLIEYFWLMHIFFLIFFIQLLLLTGHCALCFKEEFCLLHCWWTNCWKYCKFLHQSRFPFLLKWSVIWKFYIFWIILDFPWLFSEILDFSFRAYSYHLSHL